MRILLILEYFHPHIGGVETLFKQLTEQLSHQGHQITVVTNKYNKDLPAFEISNNVRIYRYRFYNRYLFTFLAWIPALFKARHADLIHTTSYNAAVPAWLAAKLTGRKTVITFHELWGELWFELPWMKPFAKYTHYLFEKLITKLHFDQFVAVSDFTKNELIKSGISPGRVKRIYNGISYANVKKENTPKTKPGYSFTYFGRVGYSKGIDILLGACSILKNQKEEFTLNMVISKEPRGLLGKINELITRYGISRYLNLRYDIEKSELEQIIRASDAVIIPSYSEGFCFVAVETMALGRPIISSQKGALKEVVSGQYIPLKQLSSEELAKSMQLAMADEWSYKPHKKFPLEDTVFQYVQLYKDILHLT